MCHTAHSLQLKRTDYKLCRGCQRHKHFTQERQQYDMLEVRASTTNSCHYPVLLDFKCYDITSNTKHTTVELHFKRDQISSKINFEVFLYSDLKCAIMLQPKAAVLNLWSVSGTKPDNINL
jgi:hypothetical protein